MIIPIKGTIIGNDYQDVYDWFNVEATSPNKVKNLIDEADGEPITVEINSGGGDLFAGVEIGNMIRTYQGEVTVDVVGLAASAASVIAMNGHSRIAPSAMLMIHNVSTTASGNKEDLEHQVEVLFNCDKAVANAYMDKTGLDEETLLNLMGDETWFDAKKAIELGFIDEVIPSSETLVNNGLARILTDTEIEDARKAIAYHNSEKRKSEELELIEKLKGAY